MDCATIILFYATALAVKLPIGENAFSFGIMVIGDKVTVQNDGHNTVRHEYGHTKQFDELGIIGFTVLVGIPSLNGFLTEVPYKRYYAQPYEAMADAYGGVDRGKYDYEAYDPVKRRRWNAIYEGVKWARKLLH